MLTYLWELLCFISPTSKTCNNLLIQKGLCLPLPCVLSLLYCILSSGPQPSLITVSATAAASALLESLCLSISVNSPLISRLGWDVPSACASCFCLLLSNDIKHFGVQFALIRRKQKLPHKKPNKHWTKLYCVRQWLIWSLILTTLNWKKMPLYIFMSHWTLSSVS